MGDYGLNRACCEKSRANAGERAAIGGYHATSRRIGWTGVGRESNPHTRKHPVGSDQLGWGGDAGVLGDLWGISGEFWADSWGGGDLPAGGLDDDIPE